MDSGIKMRKVILSLKKPSGIPRNKNVNSIEKKLSMNFSPKFNKSNYNFSSTPYKNQKFKNALLSIDKKNSNYIDYLNKNINTKLSQKVNKKRNIIINQSLENFINNKSVSINSFIRDANNSLHNSVERVPVTNNIIITTGKKLTDSVKNKILVLDYREDLSRNKKNNNINVLTHNSSINANKILTHNLRKRLFKENSRNVLNSNLINKIVKDDNTNPNFGSIENHKIKQTLSNLATNSKFLIFRTKSINKSNITKTVNLALIRLIRFTLKITLSLKILSLN